MESIGIRIRERRRALNMSQETLAKKSGICRAIISMLENGRRTDVRVSTLSSIAKALDADVNIFFA